MRFDTIQADFPILHAPHPSGKRLVYLDNAATTQKPQIVLDKIQDYYSTSNSNINRGAYDLAVKATEAYEKAREKLQHFINAASSTEIIFTKGTTDAINLLANSIGRDQLKEGDNVLISAMEHHANLIPWQMACKYAGAELRVIPMDKQGQLVLTDIDKLLDERTRMLAVVHISNALGTINPIEELIHKAHQKGIPVLVDGAQSIGHIAVDMQALDCDFFTFSGHKMFGPTGIGVLYGKEAHLQKMTPYQFGGDMIRIVRFEETSFADVPHKFEAGTPNIAGAVGLGAAVDYLSALGMDHVQAHTEELMQYAISNLSAVEGLEFIGRPALESGILSFQYAGVHPHDMATILNEHGVAIRAGHHCTQPLMRFLEIPGTARVSVSIYNTKADIDQLIEALSAVKMIFG